MSAGSTKTVVYLVDGLGLSGKTRTLAYLASHIDRRRFRPIVCSFTPGHGVLGDQLLAAGVAVRAVSCHDGFDIGAIWRLRSLLREEKAEVVHCYNPRPILYGGLAAAMQRTPRRVGSLSAFACQVPDRRYDFLPQALTTTSRRNIWRNRLAFSLMDQVTTVSESLGRRFCEFNGLSVSKLKVVPYGADLGAIEQVTPAVAATLRHEIGFDADDIVVGSVGRLVEQKDYPTQLKAFAIAAASHPRLKMVLAGDGPLETPLKVMAAELGVLDRLRFIGHWTRVPALLRSLDIFVLASKFEPFGVALLEAKAAGTAIAATRVNEVPEIVEDGVSGLLADAEDPASLARVLQTLAADADLRARLGAAAHQQALERHSLRAAVEACEQLYESGS